MEDRSDPGVVKAFHDPSIRVPPFGPFIRVQLEIAEAEEFPAAVIVDLGHAKTFGHIDPFVHVRFGKGAEIEQIRAVVKRNLVRPRSGNSAVGHLIRFDQYLLESRQHPFHRYGDNGDLRSFHPKLTVA